MAEINNGKLDLLSDKNSMLILVDYQPAMIKSVISGERQKLKKQQSTLLGSKYIEYYCCYLQSIL